jgi:transcription-repair coupling factor (superfamily II helicase)
LRVEALRVGLTEIVALKDEVRLAPVDLTASQEVRLQRLARGSVLRAAEGVIFLPAPRPIVSGLLEFLRKMWPEDGATGGTTPDRP